MSSDEGGALTPEVIKQALDDLWNMPRREPVFPPEMLVLAAAEAALRPCRATLFEPDDSIMLAWKGELIASGTPVHPRDLVHFEPLQGPAPLACVREPHPDSPWHWDGRGTWWC